MSNLQRGARVGAATFVVGFSLAWPQVAGIAAADTPDPDGSTVSAGPARAGAPSNSRATKPTRSSAKASTDTPAAGAKRVPAAAAGAGAPRSRAAVVAAVRSEPATTQIRRTPGGRVTEGAVADALRRAIASTLPGPASTAGTATAGPAVVTIAAATTPDIVGRSAAVAATPGKIGALAVLPGNDVLSTINDFLSGLVGSVQSLFEGVGLLVRRFFFNQAPTVSPVQTSGQTVGQLGGTITGSINAVDPEGDKIVYSLSQNPLHGAVTFDANGNYTYVPDNTFTGTDAFTVAATDQGLHINLFDLNRAPSTQAPVSVTQTIGTPRVAFFFTFGRGALYWSSAARADLQTSAILLSSYFIVNDPVTVTFDVVGEKNGFSGTLASAGSDLVSTNPGFYDTVVQNKILTGTDANGSAADGEITWNFGQPWALGNSVASNQYDFQSTAMHEILHTFGFLSVVDSAGNNTGTNWTTFDSFVVTFNGTQPINHTSFDWISAYNTNLTGGVAGGGPGLYFGGPNAKAAYGNKPVPLYTPSPWESGSSMSHLDDATFGGANSQLMNARTDTGLGVRTLSAIEIGILRDIGFTMADQPQTLAIFVIGLAFLRRRRRNGERVLELSCS